MAEPQERSILYARLQEVLGDETAGTLMSYLPATTELATVHDIRGLGANVEALIGRLDNRMNRLDGRMDRFEERMDRFEERMDRFEERMDRFEVRMDRFEATMIRYDDRLHEMNSALREHTRNILFYSVAVMFSMVGGAVAIASLL